MRLFQELLNRGKHQQQETDTNQLKYVEEELQQILHELNASEEKWREAQVNFAMAVASTRKVMGILMPPHPQKVQDLPDRNPADLLATTAVTELRILAVKEFNLFWNFVVYKVVCKLLIEWKNASINEDGTFTPQTQVSDGKQPLSVIIWKKAHEYDYLDYNQELLQELPLLLPNLENRVRRELIQNLRIMTRGTTVKFNLNFPD